jgi:phospholipase C
MFVKRLIASAASMLCFCVACDSFGGATNNFHAPLPATNDSPRGDSLGDYIKHVVVVIQENRSFENFFAGYPGADAPMYGYGKRPHRKDIKIPLHRISFQHEPNFEHLYQAGILDWDNGKMDGFSQWGHGDHGAYAYIEREQVKPYWTMAQRYVLADHMFPTEFGPSWTAHITLVAGTDNLKPGLALANFSDGNNSCAAAPDTRTTTVNSHRHVSNDTGPRPCFTQFRTLANTLDGAGVSWKYYVDTKDAHHGGSIWDPFQAISDVRYGRDWHTNVIAPQTHVLTDAQIGNLADVSWVTPSHEDSDHPGAHSDTGPSWVASIVNAIGKSQYWKSTAIIVLWDDWGGFYDNAPPPQLDFRGLGIRVPCLIVSPYAKRNYIASTPYEFGSILKFIEQAFGLPSLGLAADGYTDRRAHSLGDAFDFTQQPRRFEPIPSKYSIEDFIKEQPSSEPVDDQ